MGRELVDWGDGKNSYLVPSETQSSALTTERGGVSLGGGELAAVSIEAAVANPERFNASVAALPDSLKAKMIEHLNVPPMKGGAKAAERALVSRLDDAEHQAYVGWAQALSADEKEAIVSWFDGGYR